MVKVTTVENYSRGGGAGRGMGFKGILMES